MDADSIITEIDVLHPKELSGCFKCIQVKKLYPIFVLEQVGIFIKSIIPDCKTHIHATDKPLFGTAFGIISFGFISEGDYAAFNFYKKSIENHFETDYYGWIGTHIMTK